MNQFQYDPIGVIAAGRIEQLRVRHDIPDLDRLPAVVASGPPVRRTTGWPRLGGLRRRARRAAVGRPTPDRDRAVLPVLGAEA